MLRKCLFGICLLVGFVSFTQVQPVAKAPLILKKLFYKDTLIKADYTVKFTEVISDSRCPKSITCVWAGEVVFELAIYTGGKLLRTERFKIPPTSYSVHERKTLVLDDQLSLYLYTVLPFPEAQNVTTKTDYYLQFSEGN